MYYDNNKKIRCMPKNINSSIPRDGIYIVSPVLFSTTNLALEPETKQAGSRIQVQPLDRHNENQMFYLKTTTSQELITLTSCVTNLQVRLLMNSEDPTIPIVMDTEPTSSEINIWGLGAPIPQEPDIFALFNLGSNNLIFYDTNIGSFLKQTGSRFPGTSSQVSFIPVSSI